MNKRKMMLLLLATLLVVSMVGCGGTEQNAETKTDVTAEQTIASTAQETEAPPVYYQDLATEGVDEIQLGKTVKTDAITFTLDDVSLGDADGYCVIQFTVTNKTDRQLVMSMMNCYVNNYWLFGGAAFSVEAGRTYQKELSFKGSGMGALAGVDFPSSEAVKIDFGVKVIVNYMSDNMKTVEELLLAFYPKGREAWKTFLERSPGEGDTVLVDHACFRIIALDPEDRDNDSGTTLYLENKTNLEITISFDGSASPLGIELPLGAGRRMLVNGNSGAIKTTCTVTDEEGRILAKEEMEYKP